MFFKKNFMRIKDLFGFQKIDFQTENLTGTISVGHRAVLGANILGLGAVIGIGVSGQGISRQTGTSVSVRVAKRADLDILLSQLRIRRAIILIIRLILTAILDSVFVRSRRWNRSRLGRRLIDAILPIRVAELFHLSLLVSFTKSLSLSLVLLAKLGDLFRTRIG